MKAATIPLLASTLYFFPSPVVAQSSVSGVEVKASSAVVRLGTSCQGSYSYTNFKNERTDYEIPKFWMTGTGFFISSDGYIVTNAHLVAKESCEKELFQRLLKRIHNTGDISSISEAGKEDVRKNSKLEKSLQEERQVILANGDARDYEVKSAGKAFDGDGKETRVGKDVAIIKINGIKDAPTLRIDTSGNVNVGDEITVIGYPGAADISSKSLQEPSITTGKISASKPLSNDSPALQVDVRVGGGNSGSPVLNAAGEVVGVIAFARTDREIGTSFPFAVTSNTIKEFIGPAGATINQESTTDRLFREGLDFYQQGDYETAKLRFEEVTQLFPSHSQAKAWLAKAREKRNDQVIGWRKIAPWLAFGGIAGVLGVLLIGYFLLRRSLLAQVNSNSGSDMGDMSGDSPNDTLVRSPQKTQINRMTNFLRRSTVMSNQPFLTLKNQNGQEKRFYLQKARHRLGRDRAWADLVLPDDGWEVISRQHATLEKVGEDYRIYDEHSANKLMENGQPIPTEGRLLSDGINLVVGFNPQSQVTITYFHPSAHPSPSNAR
ncbi:trypsin-like peptidase domain-containing protein [Alkalinema sp. FACHB-956]|uniref:trypsin-like peptidase domain-containing protein n=1 Tax=Alkalinema sp. FACHB-956 TaxID=2692768 RepID=UPI0016881B52|nr:trypsin-like peptidase domain-containing protein [Alkalinema sp. FACHB-956]MBD2329798.1 trypsin-like peptidase domain-containing protein [Alkalinema sp. FACHB-956]